MKNVHFSSLDARYDVTYFVELFCAKVVGGFSGFD